MKHLGFIIIILFTISCNKSIVWVNDKSEIASLKSRISQLQYQIDSLRNAVTINNRLLLDRTDSLSLALTKVNNTIEQSNLAVVSIVISLDSIKSQLKTTLIQITAINNTQTKTDISISNTSPQLVALNQKYLDLLARYNKIITLINTFPFNTISDGLIAYYPFTGNANDSSGFRNNGIVQAANLTTDRNNLANAAYSFNGSSSYIDIPNKFFNNGLNEYSISIWVNPTSNIPTSGPGQTILNTNPHRGLGLGYSYNGSRKLYFFNQIDPTSNGNWDIVDDKFNYTIAINNWINIIILKKGVTFTYYVNGNLDKTTSLTQNPNSTLVSMRIGAITCCTPEYFNGKIDDIRFYNRSLNETEIAYLATH